jgi:large subunit ribosomal protein L32e
MSAAKTKAATKSVSSSMRTKRMLRKSTPKFTRHAPHRKARLMNKSQWKKPRGLHNKMKDNKRGSLPKVSDGYRTPQEVRGLHISGMEIVHVSNLKQLEGLKKETQAVVISSVGAKRQIELLNACMKHGIRVLNHKPEARINALESKRAAKQAKLDAARKAKDASTKKKNAKKPADEKLSEEDKKEQQEKIKEEVLTKGD